MNIKEFEKILKETKINDLSPSIQEELSFSDMPDNIVEIIEYGVKQNKEDYEKTVNKLIEEERNKLFNSNDVPDNENLGYSVKRLDSLIKLTDCIDDFKIIMDCSKQLAYNRFSEINNGVLTDEEKSKINAETAELTEKLHNSIIKVVTSIGPVMNTKKNMNTHTRTKYLEEQIEKEKDALFHTKNHYLLGYYPGHIREMEEELNRLRGISTTDTSELEKQIEEEKAKMEEASDPTTRNYYKKELEKLQEQLENIQKKQNVSTLASSREIIKKINILNDSIKALEKDLLNPRLTDEQRKLYEDILEQRKKEKEDLIKQFYDINNLNYKSKKGSTKKSPDESKIEIPNDPELNNILAEIVEGPDGIIDLKPKHRNWHEGVQVTGFRKNLRALIDEGENIYTVAGICPNILTTGAGVLNKLRINILLAIHRSDRIQEKFKMVQDNLDKLSEEKIKYLSDKYRGNVMVNHKSSEAIDGLIKDKIISYREETVIKPSKQEMVQLYNKTIEDYNTIENDKIAIEKINSGLITEEELAKLYSQYSVTNMNDLLIVLEHEVESLLSGKASDIEKIKELHDKIEEQYRHGIEDDDKAKRSGMNYKGRRFRRKVSTAEGYAVDKRLGELQSKLDVGIASGDDEGALKSFVEREKIQIGNTKVERISNLLPFLGWRSSGLLEYKPIPCQLDYRPDPLVRNIITTAGLVFTIYGLGNEIHNQFVNSKITEHNSQIDQVNDYNAAANKELQGIGKKMQDDNSSAVMDYTEYQAHADNVAQRAVEEYSSKDHSNWGPSEWYRKFDDISHRHATEAYESVTNKINNIQNDLMNGTMNPYEAAAAAADMFSHQHANFINSLKKCYGYFKKYAEEHTEYDYKGFLGSIESVIDNPDASVEMVQTALNNIQTGMTLGNKKWFEMIDRLDVNVKSQLGLVSSATAMTMYLAKQTGEFVRDKDNQQLIDLVKDTISADAQREEIMSQIKENNKLKDDSKVR